MLKKLVPNKIHVKFAFVVCLSGGLLTYIRTKVLADYLFLPYVVFIKIKKMSGLVSQPNFCMIFEEKYFSRYILLTNQTSLPECLYFLKYWAVCVL